MSEFDERLALLREAGKREDAAAVLELSGLAQLIVGKAIALGTTRDEMHKLIDALWEHIEGQFATLMAREKPKP